MPPHSLSRLWDLDFQMTCKIVLSSEKRTATVIAHVLVKSVPGGSWCTDSCLSPLFVMLPFKWPLIDNSLMAAVISVACAPFYHTFSSHSVSYEYAWIRLPEQQASLAMSFWGWASLLRVRVCSQWVSSATTMIVKPTDPDWETI